MLTPMHESHIKSLQLIHRGKVRDLCARFPIYRD